MGNKIILYDSDEAAIYRDDIKGWISSDGRYYGENEHLARWNGCTHIYCEQCGNITHYKSSILCPKCIEENRRKKFFEREVLNDYDFPLYCWNNDKFFFDEDDIYDFIEDIYHFEGKYPELWLSPCIEEEYRLLDEEYFTEELEEDHKLPDSILRKIDELNNELKEWNTDYWTPSTKYRIDFLRG